MEEWRVYQDMVFCSAFDERMAHDGPPALFVRTHDGDWMLSDSLSRDLTTRAGLVSRDVAHVLFRDEATGLVSWWFVTGRDLLAAHPRGQVIAAGASAEIATAYAALGRPSVSAAPA